MDLRMPRLDGIEATRRLRERQPEVRVIALTTYADDESVLGALRAGARGYLTKDASGEDIRAAILTVAAGEAALDPAVQHHVVAALAGEPRAGGRTARAAARAARRADAARGRGARADRRGPDATPRSPSASSSARRRSSRTSTTCSPRPGCATARRPSTTPTAPGSRRRRSEGLAKLDQGCDRGRCVSMSGQGKDGPLGVARPRRGRRRHRDRRRDGVPVARLVRVARDDSPGAEVLGGAGGVAGRGPDCDRGGDFGALRGRARRGC